MGVTHPQTCLVLSARLRTLRDAGFRVILVSSPGDLLWATAARERVEPIAIPMCRGIAPLADLVSLISTLAPSGLSRGPILLNSVRRKPDCWARSPPNLAAYPGAFTCCAGSSLRPAPGSSASFFSRPKDWLRPAQVWFCAIARACALKRSHCALLPARKLQLLGEGSSDGVDVERFSPGSSQVRARLGIPREAPVIGFAGRLTRDKGVPELIKAFDLILRAEPSARLLLVGWFDNSEDALGLSLRNRIRCHPQMYSTGFVSDMAPYYRAMDVLVLPTWREGFPNVVLEAAASRDSSCHDDSAPAPATPSYPHITGLLIPPGDSDAICEAVLQIVRIPSAAVSWATPPATGCSSTILRSEW